MFQWTTFWQTAGTTGFFAIAGGLWAMYVRVMGHSDKIAQLQKDVAEHSGKLDVYDTRLRAIEITTTRIDTNVSELLRAHQRQRPQD